MMTLYYRDEKIANFVKDFVVKETKGAAEVEKGTGTYEGQFATKVFASRLGRQELSKAIGDAVRNKRAGKETKPVDLTPKKAGETKTIGTGSAFKIGK